MKIKVWLFTVIVAGALVFGAAGGYVLSQGFSLVGFVAQNLRAARAVQQPEVRIMVPPGQGGWQDGGSMMPWGERRGTPGESEALPEGFNAGVSIAGTYGEMTNRTEEQVLAEAKKQETDVFGLAKQEDKLDEFKAKLREKVIASLDKMVGEGKITKGQKEAYLQRVEMILQFAGQIDTTSGATFVPGGNGAGRGNGDKPDA